LGGKGDGYQGIVIPEIYKIGSSLKINSWVRGQLPFDIAKVSILECNDLKLCGSQFEQKIDYTMSQHEGVVEKPWVENMLADPKIIFKEPVDLLKFSGFVGGVGIFLFILANAIMKASGDTIDRHVHESEIYKNTGWLEQGNQMMSSNDNMTPLAGAFGLMLILLSLLLAFGSGVWFLFRLF